MNLLFVKKIHGLRFDSRYLTYTFLYLEVILVGWDHCTLKCCEIRTEIEKALKKIKMKVLNSDLNDFSIICNVYV